MFIKLNIRKNILNNIFSLYLCLFSSEFYLKNFLIFSQVKESSVFRTIGPITESVQKTWD